jgi:hypothetical protein
MKKFIIGKRQNPAKVHAAACIPGVFEKVSIVTPSKKDKTTISEREIPIGNFKIKYRYTKGVAIRRKWILFSKST